MTSYLLHKMTASCFITTLLKSKFLPVETSVFVEGTVLYSRFYTPTGITVVFDNVVYVIDFSTWLHQTKTNYTIQTNWWIFRCLAYSIQSIFPHQKHVSDSLKTINEAIKLVEPCVSVIQNNVDHIRYDRNKGLKTLNRPEGCLSSYLWLTTSPRFWTEATEKQYRKAWLLKYKLAQLLRLSQEN